MILNRIDPPGRLYGSILAKIESEQKRAAKIKAAFSGIVSLLSVVAVIPSAQYALQGLQNSGFYQFASLAFTDSSVILIYYFKEFILSLVESVPVFELSVFLAVFLAFVISFRFLIKNYKVAFLSTQFS